MFSALSTTGSLVLVTCNSVISLVSVCVERIVFVSRTSQDTSPFCISSFLFTSFAVHPPAQMKSRSHLVTAGLRFDSPASLVHMSKASMSMNLDHYVQRLAPQLLRHQSVRRWKSGKLEQTLDISALNAARFNADKCNKGNRRSPKQSCMWARY